MHYRRRVLTTCAALRYRMRPFFHRHSPDGANIYKIRTLEMHPTIAIFELGLSFAPRMMPRKFCDDISNSSGVIMLTDKHLDRQSHIQTLLKIIPLAKLCCGGRGKSTEHRDVKVLSIENYWAWNQTVSWMFRSCHWKCITGVKNWEINRSGRNLTCNKVYLTSRFWTMVQSLWKLIENCVHRRGHRQTVMQGLTPVIL